MIMSTIKGKIESCVLFGILACTGATIQAAAIQTPYSWDFADNTFGNLSSGNNSAALAAANYTWSVANNRIEFVRTSGGTGGYRFGYAVAENQPNTAFTTAGFNTSIDLYLSSDSQWSSALWMLQAGATSSTLGYSSDANAGISASGSGYRAVIQNVIGSGYSLSIVKPGATAVVLATNTSLGTSLAGKNITLNFDASIDGETVVYIATVIVHGTTDTTYSVTATESISLVSPLGSYYGFSTQQGYNNNAYTTYFDNYSIQVPIPEASSLSILCAGYIALLTRLKRKLH